MRYTIVARLILKFAWQLGLVFACSTNPARGPTMQKHVTFPHLWRVSVTWLPLTSELISEPPQ